MPQPYEIVLNFRSKVPKSKQPQRSKLGCFNCRKLKKKCNEERPTCRACHQRCVPCVWPQGKEPMPKDYKIPPPDKAMLQRRKVAKEGLLAPRQVPIAAKGTVPNPTPNTASSSSTRPSQIEAVGVPVTTPTVSSADHERPLKDTASAEYRPLDLHSTGRIEPVDDELKLGDLDDLNFEWNSPSTASIHSVQPSTRNPSNSEMSTEVKDYEDRIPLWNPMSINRCETFITACAVGLISALAPQYTHPLLHASSTWTPFVKINSVMESVAEACGCSFMAWMKPELVPIAEQKYNAAFAGVFDYMATHELQRKDHLWLGAAFQLLAVGSKTVWTFRDKRRIDNLKGSYKLIKARMAAVDDTSSPALASDSSSTSTSPTSTTKSHSPDSPPRPNFEDGEVASDYSNDNLKMEVENSLMANEYKDDLASRFERGWLEAFLYQYGMLLLIDDVDELGLPTPFEVFTLVRKRIKKPLMNCDIAWMNHPVFGASFDAFEMACKASYLMRHLDHDMTYIAAQKLCEVVQSYQLPDIPATVRSGVAYQHLRDSSLMSEVMLRAVKILLRKIIDLRLDSSDTHIQRDVEAALHKFKQITRCAQVIGISSWALLILGLSCVKQEHKDIVIDGCFQYAEVCQSRYIYTLIDTLEISWGMRGDYETTARGLNILLERRVLEKLIL